MTRFARLFEKADGQLLVMVDPMADCASLRYFFVTANGLTSIERKFPNKLAMRLALDSMTEKGALSFVMAAIASRPHHEG